MQFVKEFLREDKEFLRRKICFLRYALCLPFLSDFSSNINNEKFELWQFDL